MGDNIIDFPRRPRASADQWNAEADAIMADFGPCWSLTALLEHTVATLTQRHPEMSRAEAYRIAERQAWWV